MKTLTALALALATMVPLSAANATLITKNIDITNYSLEDGPVCAPCGSGTLSLAYNPANPIGFVYHLVFETGPTFDGDLFFFGGVGNSPFQVFAFGEDALAANFLNAHPGDGIALFFESEIAKPNITFSSGFQLIPHGEIDTETLQLSRADGQFQEVSNGDHLTVEFNVVPEPASLAMFAVGLLGFGAVRLSQRKRRA